MDISGLRTNACTAGSMYDCTFLCCDMSHSCDTISPYTRIATSGFNYTFINNNISTFVQATVENSSRVACGCSNISIDGDNAIHSSNTGICGSSIYRTIDGYSVLCTHSDFRSQHYQRATDCNRQSINSIFSCIAKSENITTAQRQGIVSCDTLKCFVDIHE